MTQAVISSRPTLRSRIQTGGSAALNVLPEATAEHLIDYVNHGGHLVLGPRSGMKDSYNALYPGGNQARWSSCWADKSRSFTHWKTRFPSTAKLVPV